MPQIRTSLNVLPVHIHYLDLVTQLLDLQLAELVQSVTSAMTQLFFLKFANQELINQALANLNVCLVPVEHTHYLWKKSVTKHLVVTLYRAHPVFQECVLLEQPAKQEILSAPPYLTYITQSQLQPPLNHVQLGASTVINLKEFNMKFHRQ